MIADRSDYLEGQSEHPGVSAYAELKQLFHNEGRGKRFLEASRAGGPAFQTKEISRGAAFGDIDNDGAIDIVVTNNNGPVRLLRNRVGARRHWLVVKLESPTTNRFAIGAHVAVLARGEAPRWRRVHTDSSYLSSNDSRVHFGLGDTTGIEAVVVHWPDRSHERFEGIQCDRIVTLRQGTGKQS